MLLEQSENVEQLMGEDQDFRRAVEAHRVLDCESELLSHQPCLIPAEEDRLRVIKKQKLALLDQIHSKLKDFNRKKGEK